MGFFKRIFGGGSKTNVTTSTNTNVNTTVQVNPQIVSYFDPVNNIEIDTTPIADQVASLSEKIDLFGTASAQADWR